MIRILWISESQLVSVEIKTITKRGICCLNRLRLLKTSYKRLGHLTSQSLRQEEFRETEPFMQSFQARREVMLQCIFIIFSHVTGVERAKHPLNCSTGLSIFHLKRRKTKMSIKFKLWTLVMYIQNPHFNH